MTTFGDPDVVVPSLLKFAQDHAQRLNGTTPRDPRLPKPEAMNRLFDRDLREAMAPFVWWGDYS